MARHETAEERLNDVGLLLREEAGGWHGDPGPDLAVRLLNRHRMFERAAACSDADKCEKNHRAETDGRAASQAPPPPRGGLCRTGCIVGVEKQIRIRNDHGFCLERARLFRRNSSTSISSSM